MNANRIRLERFFADTGLIKAGAKRPDNLFNFALANDIDSEIIEEMELTPENKEKAIRWLRTKRNTCKEVNGFAGSFYQVEAYGIEYFEVDENGEFVEGSDFDGAKDEREVLQ